MRGWRRGSSSGPGAPRYGRARSPLSRAAGARPPGVAVRGPFEAAEPAAAGAAGLVVRRGGRGVGRAGAVLRAGSACALPGASPHYAAENRAAPWRRARPAGAFPRPSERARLLAGASPFPFPAGSFRRNPAVFPRCAARTRSACTAAAWGSAVALGALLFFGNPCGDRLQLAGSVAQPRRWPCVLVRVWLWQQPWLPLLCQLSVTEAAAPQEQQRGSPQGTGDVYNNS